MTHWCCGGLVALVALCSASSAHADDECGGYAMRGDVLFNLIGNGTGGQATVLHSADDARACIESAACVENVFPIENPRGFGHDDCPFAYGRSPDDAQRLSALGPRAATLNGSCFLRFALVAAGLQRHEFAPLLRKQVGADDARVALAAALALRDLGDADAVAWRIASQHWYPPLRELARDASAGTADAGLRARAGDSFWTRVNDIGTAYAERYCEAQPVSWRGKRQLADDRADEEDEITAPLGTLSLQREQGWPVCLPVVARMPLGEGVLVGTNMGEWGGAAYYFRAPELPRPLLADNVRGVRKSGSRVQLFAGLAHLSLSESRMYRIELDAQRVPAIVTTIEMPEAPWRAQWHGEGAITIVGLTGIVYELGSNDAHPQVLGCVRHLRPFGSRVPRAESPEPFED